MKKVIFFVSLVVFILLYNVFICQTMNFITTITDDVDFNSSADIYFGTLIGAAICVGVYISFSILSNIAKTKDESFLNFLSIVSCIMLGAAIPSIFGFLCMDDIHPCGNFIEKTHNHYSSLCDKNGNTIIENEDYTFGNVSYYIGDTDRWHEKVLLQVGFEGEDEDDNYVLKIKVYDYKTYKLLEVGKLFVSHNDYDEDTLVEILDNYWDDGKYKDICGHLRIGSNLCYEDYEEIYTNYDESNRNDNEIKNESEDYEEDNDNENSNRPSPHVIQKPVEKFYPCGGCNGRGICSNCNGSGRNPYNNSQECMSCNGTRVCNICGGQRGTKRIEYIDETVVY